MKILKKLLRPTGLLSGFAGILIFVDLYVGPQFLSWLWVIVIAVAILLLWLTLVLMLRYRAKKAAEALEESLDQQAVDQLQTTRPGREAEVENLREALVDAIGALKNSRVGKASAGSALYVLPWYMIIGPPASGKTTMLEHSGLNFPYLDPLRKSHKVRGVGGTRNCDWWFAEQAVILDTAGRYVLPVEADDTAEWLSFLDLLKRHRSKKPLNGLIVGVSIEELLAKDEQNVEDHAKRIRTRIDELSERLGISFPIYVVFTKCDLIRGFVEYFGELAKAERAEVWGATFSRSELARSAAGDLFREGLATLSSSLHESCLFRLSQESRAEIRSEILFFPYQFDAVEPRISLFIDSLFRENPYQHRPIFRGFYFTSGTQEGRPLDQVIKAMWGGEDRAEEEEVYGEPAETKSYFIENVFSQIIFPDRHIAGPSAEQERKKRLLRVKVFTAAAIGMLLLFGGLIWGSAANRVLLNRTRVVGDQAVVMVQKDYPTLENLKNLDELRGLLEKMENRARPMPRMARLFTHQADLASWEARNLYLSVLVKAVLQPPTATLQRDLIRNATTLEAGFAEYFDWYRVWRVMLDPGSRLDRGNIPAVASFLTNYSQTRGNLRLTEAQLEEYERLLVENLEYASRYPSQLSSLFSAISRESRDADEQAGLALRTYWRQPIDYVYPSIRIDVPEENNVTLSGILPGSFSLADSVIIPGVYTAGAWNGPVREVLEKLERYRDDPAMERAYGKEPPTIRPYLVSKYSEEYTRSWLYFLESLRMNDLPADEVKAFIDNAAKDESSSIFKILREVLINTRFENPDPNLTSTEESFAPIREFFMRPDIGEYKNLEKGDTEQALHLEYLEKVTAIAAGFSDIAGSPRPEGTIQIRDLQSWIDRKLRPETAVNPVTVELARILRFPAVSVTGTIEKGVTSGLEMEWAPVFSEFRSLSRQYPLNRNGNDVPLQDFSRFFGEGGTFWTFYENNLAGSVTREGVIVGSGVRVSSSFRRCLKQANKITTALFSGGPNASFSFSVRGQRVTPDASNIATRTVRFDLGGEPPMTWNMGQPRWTQFSWPGAASMEGVRIQLDAGSVATQPIHFTGPWGFFRLLDVAQHQPGGQGADLALTWRLQAGQAGVRVTLEIGGLASSHPLSPGFFTCQCPSAITGGN